MGNLTVRLLQNFLQLKDELSQSVLEALAKRSKVLEFSKLHELLVTPIQGILEASKVCGGASRAVWMAQRTQSSGRPLQSRLLLRRTPQAFVALLL